jgi:putative nucleotidyltransferase with HDIG domain
MLSLAPLHRAVAAKDDRTALHAERVALLARALGEALELRGRELENIVTAALIHDLGKVYVPDAILNKAAPLTLEEQRVMRSHVLWGEAMLRPTGADPDILAVVRSHHEWWNGRGYPDGRAGMAIPLGARIVAVCDAFDAMTSDRPYRRALPLARAVALLEEGAGVQFDPSLVGLFLGGVALGPAAVAVA